MVFMLMDNNKPMVSNALLVLLRGYSVKYREIGSYLLIGILWQEIPLP
ncbi:hypothetical protein [Helicobacter japonicus]|nr:hypothetical protein [Helicobacter japonicus]